MPREQLYKFTCDGTGCGGESIAEEPYSDIPQGWCYIKVPTFDGLHPENYYRYFCPNCKKELLRAVGLDTDFTKLTAPEDSK